MVDVRERQEAVQRRVDGSRHAALTKCSEGVITHHLVFVGFAFVARNQVLQLVEIQQSKACFGDAAEVAPASLNGQDSNRFTGKGICEVYLRAGITTGEVGDAQIRTQQI